MVRETEGLKDKSRGVRRLKQQRFLRHCRAIAKSGFMICGYYVSNGRIKRVSRGPRSKYLKHASNKTVRSASLTYHLTPGQYRRLYDYWWELW